MNMIQYYQTEKPIDSQGQETESMFSHVSANFRLVKQRLLRLLCSSDHEFQELRDKLNNTRKPE